MSPNNGDLLDLIHSETWSVKCQIKLDSIDKATQLHKHVAIVDQTDEV